MANPLQIFKVALKVLPWIYQGSVLAVKIIQEWRKLKKPAKVTIKEHRDSRKKLSGEQQKKAFSEDLQK